MFSPKPSSLQLCSAFYHDSHTQSISFDTITELQWPQDVYVRRALDTIADNLLSLAQYITKFDSQQRSLIHRRKQLYQKRRRISDIGTISSLEEEIKLLTAEIAFAKRAMLRAIKTKIPSPTANIRLMRLSGRLTYPSTIECDVEVEMILHQKNISALRKILALPTTTVLEDLAIHLLTTSFPFSEACFRYIMYRLSVLRYHSAARAVYYHVTSCGIPMDSARSIGHLLIVTARTGNRKEFANLERLINPSVQGFDYSVSSALVLGHLRFNQPEHAWNQVRTIVAHGAWPTLRLLTRLLRDAKSRRHWTYGFRAWEMIEEGERRKRFQIDAWAYHEMWRLCQVCFQVSVAASIYRDALAAGFEPDMLRRNLKWKRLPVKSSNKAPKMIDVLKAIHHRRREIASLTDINGLARSVGTLERELLSQYRLTDRNWKGIRSCESWLFVRTEKSPRNNARHELLTDPEAPALADVRHQTPKIEERYNDEFTAELLEEAMEGTLFQPFQPSETPICSLAQRIQRANAFSLRRAKPLLFPSNVQRIPCRPKRLKNASRYRNFVEYSLG